MGPEQLASLSEQDKKTMGINSPEAAEQDQFVDEKGRETPFSKDGLLNRNYGQDVEKPSNAMFYRDGILNRAKFHEIFTEVYNREMNAGSTPEKPAETSAETKGIETPTVETPAIDTAAIVQETQVDPQEIQEIEAAVKDLFDVFKNDKDPEGAAFQYIRAHLNPSLSPEEQRKAIREFKTDYLKYKSQLK